MSENPSPNWPRKGDKAFTLSGSPADPALVAAFVLPTSGGYAVGFKDAADMVVEAAARDDRNPDVLFFPVAYLYRHCLELTLKDILRISAETGAIVVPELSLKRMLGRHDLRCLWERVREAIEAVWPEGERADVDSVESIILEYDNLDKSGQALRYPADKDGKPHLSTDLKCVSLHNLKKRMDGVFTVLEGVHAGIVAADPGPAS